ncbi:MAG: T9SS type A sorting domain-containing protein [Bacteroidetes bacterium]|nr:T9SS type A sorting domain-containing protein [Bacteroidota bacterium]
MRFTHLLMTGTLFIMTLPLFGQHQYWQILDESKIVNRSDERWIVPKKYGTLSLDVQKFSNFLADVPLRFNENHASKLIELPMPNGDFEHYEIVEAPIMHPRLASKFPMIRCFTGQGVEDKGALVYLDITQKGVHAMILKQGETFYIDPYFANENETYIAYKKVDFIKENKTALQCLEDDSVLPQASNNMAPAERIAGVNLRTFDLAIAAAGEYTQFHGGTVADGLAAIVTAVNRVRGIYETELAISFELVADNNLLIYTNPSTDPYSSPPTLAENQSNIDAVIGNANYDLGHVVGIGTGGIATLNSTCINSSKARGMTALDSPVGDPFYIDFLAHEIGHQFGAHHTFNGDESNCGSAGTYPSSAFEPGSGSTIMAYAGICGSQNLQINSHAYFHRISLDEITKFVDVTIVDIPGCETVTATGNNCPVIDADPDGMDGKYIPISTPFELTANATDPDGDPIVYNWEQMDLGDPGTPSPSESGPILRSYPPSASPTRNFPLLNAILDNTTIYGEFLPSISRTLKFIATARDNNINGGGNASDSIMLNVTNSAGPFSILNFNSTAIVSGTIFLQWNVANTTDAPVNCANVDILLSYDGGQTFSLLVGNTPNDGNELVTLPNIATGQARIKVKCADNVFFDINNADLRIAPSDASCSEKITSGSFSSSTGWTETSTNYGYVISNWGLYHKADGSAWLGYADDEVSTISQTITIPSAAHFASLEYWYKLEATDCGNDIFRVKINGVVVKNYTLCNDPATGSWVRQLIDLSGYKGTSPTIMFEVINNSNSPTDVIIDDVSVYVCEGGSFSPLPVELMEFEAKPVENMAKLHWSTASETDNRGFDVEMQNEYGDYQTLGFVPGKGTSNEISNYYFEVPGLKPGTYYFRLRQKNENGQEEFSPIRSVQISGITKVEVSPNPVSDVAFFEVTLEKPSLVHLQILDGLGRVVGTVTNDEFGSGNFDLAYNVSQLTNGIYYYHMVTGNTDTNGRFIVNK